MATPTPVSAHPHERWSRWSLFTLERLSLPYWLLVLLAGLAAALEQWLEVRGAAPLQRPPTPNQALTFVVLLVYALLSLRFLKQKALDALVELRPAILIGDTDYELQARRMVGARGRIELTLLGAAVIVALALFLPETKVLSALRNGMVSLPLVIYILLTWTLLGWVLLLLAQVSIQQARALAALASCRLAINVYGPANLFPFGRLSVWHGLVIAGLAMTPLILLGLPTQAGYLVVGLSTISLLAVFIPLWGVRGQISAAKATTLAAMDQGLVELQTDWLKHLHDATEMGPTHAKIEMLLTLRKVVAESPNWPFRNESAIMRAAIAAVSPLIYFILNRLIETFVFPVLTR